MKAVRLNGDWQAPRRAGNAHTRAQATAKYWSTSRPPESAIRTRITARGVSSAGPLPITLGHEIAGVVEALGPGTVRVRVGDRVALHYLVTCGQCRHCNRGQEQFCEGAQMLGKQRDGGYAEYIAVPERGVVPLPDEVGFEQGAIMMCSSSTSFHATAQGAAPAGRDGGGVWRWRVGHVCDPVGQGTGRCRGVCGGHQPCEAGTGGHFGAIPVDASQGDPVALIRRLTGGKGVDVALELIGLPVTMRQAVQVLGVQGRAALAGITRTPFEVDSYQEVIGREAEIVGVSDHLLQEFPQLMEFARRGVLDLSHVVTKTVPLEAGAINAALDALERWGGEVRTVIIP